MSYNTRRGGGFAPANSAASVGQRRPAAAAINQQTSIHFVSGGVNPPNNLTKPPTQAPVQQQYQQHAQQDAIRHQPPQQQLPPQQQQKPFNNAQQTSSVLHLITPKKEPDGPQQPIEPVQSDEKLNANGNESEALTKKPKPAWMKSGAGRISKREILRRRNERLRKVLQPKNALMVLNELVGSTVYNVTESADVHGNMVFKCGITVDGREHVGIGKSKAGAKGAAAEAALKHLVQTRYKKVDLQSGDISTEQTVGDGEDKMETTDDEPAGKGGVSWSHVASYALHKLLSEWDEGAGFSEKLCVAPNPSASSIKAKPQEKKPAKQLPEAAATMNPIMLLNQMRPNAVYEEVSKIGNPPHVRFTVKCNIDGDEFIGMGSNKKSARKICAFSACIKLLGMQYTPAFMEENGVTIDGSGNVVYIQHIMADQQAMQVA